MESSPPEPNSVARPSRSKLLRAVIKAPDSYGLLFVFLIVYYVLVTIDWTGPAALLVRATWGCLTTLLAFWTSRVPRRVLLAVAAACAITFVVAAVIAVTGGTQADGVTVLMAAALGLSTPIAIGWRTLQHHSVSGETIMGALCIYVLIGFIFANVDYGMQLVSGNSYFAQPGQHGPPDFVYFSYITMATVGYGDLTPAPGLPRTTAALEALVGQIFLVVLVARLVSLYAPSALRRAEIRRLAEDQKAADPAAE